MFQQQHLLGYYHSEDETDHNRQFYASPQYRGLATTDYHKTIENRRLLHDIAKLVNCYCPEGMHS